MSEKQRHGLFSQPITTAIGEDNLFKKPYPARDDEGKVALKPRNFTTKQLKKGKNLDSIYFQKPASYVCTGDVYKNPPEAQLRGAVKDGYKEIGKQDVDWKYAKTVRNKIGYKASYAHMNDRVEIIKNYRDEDGAVISAPRNITNKPPKSGRVGPGTSFGGMAKHMPCLFDAG